MFVRRTHEGMSRLWARRWFRRMTYVLASGTVCTVGALWTVRQHFFNRWLVSKLDEIVRENTGLGLQAEHLEFHLFQSRAVLRGFAVGGDLVQGDRLEIQFDLPAYFSGSVHILNLELDNPRILVDAERLARIHLKPSPKNAKKPQVFLDNLNIHGGQVWFKGADWGMPDAELAFRVYGQGTGPNGLQVDLRVPKLLLKNTTSTLSGSLSVTGDLDLSGDTQTLKRGELRLGRSTARFHGSYEPEPEHLAGDLRGSLDMKQIVQFLVPSHPQVLEGQVEIKTQAEGTLKNPSWNVVLQGTDMASPEVGLLPGSLQINARGDMRAASLKDLHWSSAQGELQGTGEWKRGKGTQLQFRGEKVALVGLANWVRVPFLRGVTAGGNGELHLPGDPWNPFKPESTDFTFKGSFERNSEPTGACALHLSKGLLVVDDLNLVCPELTFTGKGQGMVGSRGLQSIEADGEVETNAAQVAEVLGNWKIGFEDKTGQIQGYNMAGQAKAQARVHWNPKEGLQLRGHADIVSPRWEEATGDRLQADVSIQDENLRIENILLEKGDGVATGDLWLTWRDGPAGAETIDMCYQASRLPIEEGMKASGLEHDFVEGLGISGLGSGWVRIHGPNNHLLIEGSAQAESAQVAGIKIPALSGDMDFDLAGDRLSLKQIRVAATPEQLGSLDEGPTGDLALLGDLDLDLKRSTWHGSLKGRLDSLSLGIPGPRFQAQADLHLNGPWGSDAGPVSLPGAILNFEGGRIFFLQLSEEEGLDRLQSLEGLHGIVESGPGGVHAKVGMGDHPDPLLDLELWPQDKAFVGVLDVHINPRSADTAHLASSLTQDLLKDGVLDLSMDARLDETGLHWKGRTKDLIGRFDGFDVQQEQPGLLEGNGDAASLDLRLHARQTLAGIADPSEETTGAIKISGQLPFADQQPMSLRFEGQAKLADIKSILDHVMQTDPYSLLGYIKPRGLARFDLKAAGPYDSFTLDGNLSLTDGSLVMLTYPQSIENLSFNVRFRGRDIFLLESEPLTGRLAQGQLQAWGQATWDFGGLTRYDFRAKLQDFQLRDLPEGFDLRGSLDATLSGDDEKGKLQGSLIVDQMLYQAEINLRDFILSNSLGGSGFLSPANLDDPLANIALDLDVQLKKDWEIDTNLLKVQGRPTGPFKIRGSLLEPGFFGAMEIVPGGRVTNLLPAGDIVLEEGVIAFPDPTVFSPRMDLKGRVDVSPFAVNLNITGSLETLDMKATSTPSLRQDEIIAILIDPSQASTIGSSAGPLSQTALNSGLAATGSGLVQTLALAQFQDGLRRSLGLDRVNVVWRAGTVGNSETDITVGKNLNLSKLRIPLVYSHRKVGDVITQSGQVEWRFGNFVLQLGVSQSGSDNAGVAGEIRHTWVPRW